MYVCTELIRFSEYIFSLRLRCGCGILSDLDCFDELCAHLIQGGEREVGACQVRTKGIPPSPSLSRRSTATGERRISSSTSLCIFPPTCH